MLETSVGEVLLAPSSSKPPSRARPKRARRSAVPALRNIGLRLSGIFAVLVLFQILAVSNIVPGGYLPPVTDIYAELWERFGTAGFWNAVLLTLQGWFFGVLAATALAVPLGVLIGTFEPLFRLTRGTIDFLRPIPSVAIIPAAVLILGTDQEIKVFLIAFATFWPIITQTVYGVHDTDPTALDTVRSYGLGRIAQFTTVTIPSAAPYVATGLRIASAIGLVLAITTELIVGVAGLGSAIAATESAGAVTGTYALILATGLLGWGLNGVVRIAEARTLHWHESFRG